MESVDLLPAPSSPVDPEAWADTTSRELMAVQAQNGKLSAEQRAELVEKRLRERIGLVADSQRRGCLRALAGRFPLRESNSGGVTAEAPPLTATSWVTSFDSIKEGLTPELKKALFEKLKSAGCLPASVASTAAGIPIPGSLEPLLPKEAIDPARVTQFLDVIFEAARALDGNFRRVWEGVASFGKTDHGLPRYTFEEIMRKFLTGDQDVPRVVLKNRIETTTKLVPAVLIAVKDSWDAMDADLANSLPDEIQKRVKIGALERKEVAWWREYCKGAEKLHPDTRVREFFEQVVTKARTHIPR